MKVGQGHGRMAAQLLSQGRSMIPGTSSGKGVAGMAVFRVEKDTNYTTMCNYHLRDRELSLKAKGLLSLFLSLPDEWHYSVRGISAICREGVDGINSTLQELEKHGYLTRRQLRQKGEKMGETEYVIYERPRPFSQDTDSPCLEPPCIESPCVEKPCTENPHTDPPCTEKPYTAKPYTEEPCTENPTQINKDITSTERTNTDQNNERESKQPVRHRYGQYRNVLLSDEEMEKMKSEYPNDYQQRIERLSEYMASTGKIYKNHLATIRSWAKRDEQKAQEAAKKAGSYSHSNYQFASGDSL